MEHIFPNSVIRQKKFRRSNRLCLIPFIMAIFGFQDKEIIFEQLLRWNFPAFWLKDKLSLYK
jgi:hypothetical protein